MLLRVARLTFAVTAGLLVSAASAENAADASPHAARIETSTCSITGMTVNAADAVFTDDGFYSQPVEITYVDPPATGFLGVYAETTRWIASRTVAITGSPQMVILNGLRADSSDVTVTATFSADPCCTLTEAPLFVTLSPSSGQVGPPVDVDAEARDAGYEIRYTPSPEGGTVVHYSVANDGDVSLRVYSVMGRRVRTLFDGHASVGTHDVLWNGYDDGGNAVPSGMYFAVLRAHGVKSSRGIMLLR